MKKVLHLASWYPNRKGPQEGDFIKRQLQALAGYIKVEVIAVVKDDTLKPGEVDVQKMEDGNLSETIAYYNSYKTGWSKADSLFSLLAFKKTFRNLIGDYVRVNGRPDLIHVHVAFRAGIAARRAALDYGVPYIVSEHWSGYKKEDKAGVFYQASWTVSIIQKILDDARLILPVSESLMDDIKQHTKNRAFSVVHNVVDESFFAPPADLPQSGFRFLHVSTMGPEKQPQMIFKAFDALRAELDAKLVCLGTVPEGLKEWAGNNIRHHHDIIFRGNVPYEMVAREMRDADCLVIASQYETFSCVAAEALLSGLPVISSPVGIVPDLIRPQNGLMYRDEAGLLTAMRDICQNRDRYNRFEIAAAQQGKFSYQSIGSKLVELYNSL